MNSATKYSRPYRADRSPGPPSNFFLEIGEENLFSSEFKLQRLGREGVSQ
jgi:hypothetical protein